MRRITIIMFCLVISLAGKAQIAKWLIPPSYEKIGIADGADAIITDSSGVKSIWSMDGKRLIKTTNEVNPFREGMAVSTKPGTTEIVGIYSDNGKFKQIEGCNTTYDYPYFSNGLLLVKKGSFYKYIEKDGNISEDEYVQAYPCFNGYAVCEKFLNSKKQRDACYYLMSSMGENVQFTYNGKSFDIHDVEFISSVNDENTAVVVIKHKVYFFDGMRGTITPVYATEGAVNIKEQAKIDSDFGQTFKHDTDSTHIFQAKCGKDDYVFFCFDSMLRLITITRNDKKYEYKVKREDKKVLNSPLKPSKNGKLMGILWNSEDILPPQFDEIVTCMDNKAIVKLKGKYGMLEIDKEHSFRLRMNKGDDIPFKHQKFETTLRLDLPTYISANRTSIEIDTKTGCNLDKTSKQSRNTESGNYVEYNCVLNIPEDLPDELTEIEYPLKIQYDGITSTTIPFKVKAWYYKYFVVDLDDSQTSIDNGTVSFVFNINADRSAGDGVYHTTVNILTDSLSYEIEKMSEIRYKCKVISLNEGVNNIVVQILEQGCPPASFPFEVEYHKPVSKLRNKQAEKEKVTIKKKPNASQTISEPRVIM
ncbi:MAG: WG repeat-containing protein [Prevotella sp.]|nr:WG repeat-containing protein [Prevotella sp.]